MNIEDFKIDADNLIGVYHRREEGYYEYLKKWLKARKYTEEELVFLVEVISMTLDNIPKKYTISADPLAIFPAVLELIDDISPKGRYPISFDEVEGEFVRFKEKLLFAERWAFELGYIDQDGKWHDKKGSLGAFLRLLQQFEIIHRGKESVKYFSDRYDMEDIHEQMKKSKAAPFEKKLLSSGLEEAIKFPKKH